MSNITSIKYEVIGRAVTTSKPRRVSKDDAHPSHTQHSLNLLYRSDGTPWWTCSSGITLIVPPDFDAQPGDMLTLTLQVAE